VIGARLLTRGIITTFTFLVLCFARQTTFSAESQPTELRVWPSEPPADIPFAPSQELTGLAFTGRHAHYENADTWYPTWAANGNLYSPWTDGKVNGISADSSAVTSAKATTGYAAIVGDDPLHLTVTNEGVYPASPRPYEGRYPAGSLVYNGVWFYGTYCLKHTEGKGLNWDILGPFVGFRYSTDYGQTWQESPHTPDHPLFDEPTRLWGPVKLGLPHFVDFGKNMEHSPDGKAYIVSQGAIEADPKPRDANLSWITGDQVYLARV